MRGRFQSWPAMYEAVFSHFDRDQYPPHDEAVGRIEAIWICPGVFHSVLATGTSSLAV
jgi:hypothetical protein